MTQLPPELLLPDRDSAAADPISASPARTALLRRLGALSVLLAAVALAGLPSLLVVLDYWLGNERISELCLWLWLRLPFLATVDWPSYLPVVVAALAALMLLFVLRRRDAPPWTPGPPRRAAPRQAAAPRIPLSRVSLSLSLSTVASVLIGASSAAFLVLVAVSLRRHRIPGWEILPLLALFAAGLLLREVRPRTLLRLWRRKAPVWLILAALQVSLLGAFAASSSGRRWGWIVFLLPAAVVFAVLRSKKRIPVWGWIVLLAIAVRTFRIDSWLYTMVGDEYAFWQAATDIVQNNTGEETFGFIVSHLFTMEGGVYNQSPYLVSALQALGMVGGGVTNFGWKLSNIWLTALAIPFFYGFFRTFTGRRVATLACFLLACSEYLMSFSKIGYPNLQAHFAMALVLSSAAWAARSHRLIAYVCLGFSGAFCLYVYPAALYCLPLAPLLLLFYDPPRTPRAAGRWGIALAAFLMASAPMLMQAQFYVTKVRGTFYARGPMTASKTAWLLSTNAVYALLSHLRRPVETHFVGISYMDPLSAALIALGFTVVVRRFPRDRFAAYCVAATAVLVILVASSAEPPSATRMFMLLPGYVLFGGIGIAWIADQARRAGLGSRGASRLTAGVLAAVLVSNLVHAYVISPRIQVRYQHFQAIYNRIGQRLRDESRGRDPKIVFLAENLARQDYENRLIAQVYRLPTIVDVQLVNGRVPAGAMATLKDPDAIVIIRPDVPRAVADELGPVLAESGRYPCSAMDMAKRVQIVEWQFASRPRFCD